MAIQTKLIIENRYSGPIDGKWSLALNKSIRNLLDENYYFYTSNDDDLVLEILGINNEIYKSNT